MMNIHLSKPGGQREGPFSLDQINQDLAAHKYHDSDYWAWYEGLSEWVPLHQVPGVIRSAASESQEIPGPEPKSGTAGDTEIIFRQAPPSDEEVTSPEDTSTEETDLAGLSSSPEDVSLQEEAPAQETSSPSESVTESESAFQQEMVGEAEAAPQDEAGEIPISEQEIVPEQESSFSEEAGVEPADTQQEESVQQEEQVPIPEEATAPQEFSPPTEEAAQPAEAPPSLSNQLFSGMPFEALEQVILLSSGDAQNASRSAVTSGMLEAATGAVLGDIREKVPRDAMGGCAFLERLREGGRISDAALRAAAKLKPDLVRQAREGLYRICVRTYPIETGEMAALFLFYNKKML